MADEFEQPGNEHATDDGIEAGAADPFADAPPPDDLDFAFHEDDAGQPLEAAQPPAFFDVDSALAAAVPRSSKPTMPADPEAERALLASILIDSNALIHAMGRVRGEDFWDRRNGLIFDAMQRLALAQQPYDAVSIQSELLRANKDEQAGGLPYLVSLSQFAGSASSAAHYAHQVQRLATVRRIIGASAKIQAAGYENGGDPDAVISTAQSEMNAALEGAFGADAASIADVVGPVYDRIMAAREHEGEVTGIPTGYRDLDKLLLGIHRTDLVILAARPAMGKTSFALNLGLNIARTHVPLGHRAGEAGSVLVFSLEMGKDQLVQRLLSQRSRIGLSELRKGNISADEEVALRTAAADLSELNFFIDDTPALTTVDLAARAKRTAMQHGLDLIVVDYLQLMRGTGGSKQSREQEISEISRTLKGLAKELNVTVLALSQLNRSLESRADKRPMMSDLRESGAIEQDADIILFVYRDWVYHAETAPENLAELIIAKHRAGPTGKVEMHFEGKFTRFSNLDDRFGDAYAGVPGVRFG
ncbi:MAG: replicative helicase [Pseudomonadota bacterium]